MNKNLNTKGNQYELYQSHSRLDIRKYFLQIELLQFLPDYVVMVESTVLFKKRLDKFWSNQAIVFNFEAELEGTGSRSNIDVIFDVDIET